MPGTDQQFAALMQRLRNHSEGAARQLVEQYGKHILRVVRAKLPKKLRTKFNSSDFVQAVWISFFALPPERMAFDHPESLGAFLAQLANNKVVESVRQRLQGLKYNINRECSLEDPNVAPELIVDPAASPEAIAIARDEWDRLARQQPERHREVVRSLGEGWSPRQVAEQLGLSEKTILRVIRNLKSQKSHE